jgi:hypothetical protein
LSHSKTLDILASGLPASVQKWPFFMFAGAGI